MNNTAVIFVTAIAIVFSLIVAKRISITIAKRRYEREYLHGLCALGDEIMINPNGQKFVIRNGLWQNLGKRLT